MYKILILTPVWRRPEILNHFPDEESQITALLPK